MYSEKGGVFVQHLTAKTYCSVRLAKLSVHARIVLCTFPQHTKKKEFLVCLKPWVYAYNHCLATAGATVSKSGDVGLLLPAIQPETKPELIFQLLKSKKNADNGSQSENTQGKWGEILAKDEVYNNNCCIYSYIVQCSGFQPNRTKGGETINGEERRQK